MLQNELMKFFFRIIDHNKPKPTDNPTIAVPQFTLRPSRKSRSSGERVKRYSQYLTKKSHRKTIGKVSNSSSKAPIEHDVKKEIKFDHGQNDLVGVQGCDDAKVNLVESGAQGIIECQSSVSPPKDKVKQEKCDDRHVNFTVDDINSSAVVNKTEKENDSSNRVPKDEVIVRKPDMITTNMSPGNVNNVVSKVENTGSKNIPLKNSESAHKHILKESSVTVKKEPDFEETDDNKFVFKISREYLDDSNRDTSQSQVISKPVTKSYTSITLNRSENVEIITEIEPVSNKNGKSFGHHIIKQTIKKGSKVKSSNSPKKLPIPKLRITRSPLSPKKLSSKRGSKLAITHSPVAIPETLTPKRESAQASSSSSSSQVLDAHSKRDHNREQLQLNLSDEQFNFFRYLNLFPKTSQNTKKYVRQPSSSLLNNEVIAPSIQQPKKQIIISRSSHGHKRKSSSPIKTDRSKVLNLDTKKAIQLFLQGKSPSPSTSDSDVNNDEGLKSLINTCKIPSSLSITIKQSSEGDSSPVIVPPVKNYIEILKLPDELSNSDKSNSSDKDKSDEPAKLDLSKFCDNDSEQKVDEDISEIAKSLTEKIPMSTTISQIVAPKPNFDIPVKTNISSKVPIQPTPVPELSKALGLASPKDTLSKLNPRSSQTFQRIFEESLKKPGDGSKVATIELAIAEESDTPLTTNQTSGKRKILELTSELLPKTAKLDPERKSDVSPLPKVQIPRLPSWRHQKTLKHQPGSKMVAQTVASLHSSSLGMNYTVSVGQQNTSKVLKASGIVSPVKTNSVPEAPEHKPSDLSETNSTTVDFKVPSPSVSSPKLPDAAGSGCSTPRPKTPSPKHSPKSSPLVKHMYAPSFTQRVPSPMSRLSSTSRNKVLKPKPSSTSPKPSTSVPSAKSLVPIFPMPSESDNPTGHEIVDKYNAQVLKNNINLNPVLAGKQLAAFQHAFLLNHIEMRHRQNWVNRNQGHLLQFEKYLQTLNGGINGPQGQT